MTRHECCIIELMADVSDDQMRNDKPRNKTDETVVDSPEIAVPDPAKTEPEPAEEADQPIKQAPDETQHIQEPEQPTPPTETTPTMPDVEPPTLAYNEPAAEPAKVPTPTPSKPAENTSTSDTKAVADPVVDQAPKSENPTAVPSPTPPEEQQIDINSLSDEQLKAAAALWAKKNQRTLSQLGVKQRQTTAAQNMADIKKFIANHSPASNRTIARALNLPPKTVQYYMQLLTKQGFVRAEGWAVSRRYFIK